MTNTLQIKYSDKSDATLEKDELLRGEIALNIKDDKLFYRSASSEDNESSDSVKSVPLLDEDELKQVIKENSEKGLQHFEESTWDSDEYKSVLLKPKNAEENTTVAIVPKGTGAFTLSDYGVKLGEKSVDLQIYNYSPVKTNYSVCTGGTGNNVNSDYSVICGGGWNTIQDSSQGFIGGGVSNSLRGWNSAILCGSNNEINGNDANFIASGKENKMLGLEWKKDSDGSDGEYDYYHVHFSFIAGTDNTLQGQANTIIGYDNKIVGDSITYDGKATHNTSPAWNFVHGSSNTIAGTGWNTIIGSQSCCLIDTSTSEWGSNISHCTCISSHEVKVTNSNLVTVIGAEVQKIDNSSYIFLGPLSSSGSTYGGTRGITNSKRTVVLTGNMTPDINDSEAVFWPITTTGRVKNSRCAYVFSDKDNTISVLGDPTTKEDTTIGCSNVSIHDAYSAEVRGTQDLFSSAFNFTAYNTNAALLLNSDAININGGIKIDMYHTNSRSQYSNVIGSRQVTFTETQNILNLSSHAVSLGGAQDVTLIQCDKFSDSTTYNSVSYSSNIRGYDIKTVNTVYNSVFINSRYLNNAYKVSNSSNITVNNARFGKISNVALAKLDCTVDGKLEYGYSIDGFGVYASNLGMSNHSYHSMAEGTSIKGTYTGAVSSDYVSGVMIDTSSPYNITLTGNNTNKKFQTGKVYLQLVMKEPDISKPTFMTKANYDSSNSKRPDATNASFIVVPDNGYMFFDFKADFVNGTSIVTIEMKNGVLHNDGSKIEVVRQPVVTSNDTSANSIQLSITQIEQSTILDLKQVAFSVDSTLDASAFASGVFDYRLMY